MTLIKNSSFIKNIFLKNYIKQNEDLFDTISNFIKNKDMKSGKNSFSTMFDMNLKNKLNKEFGYSATLQTKSRTITLEKNNIIIQVRYGIDEFNKKEKYNSKYQEKHYIYITNITVLSDKMEMDFYTSKYILKDDVLSVCFNKKMIIFDTQRSSFDDYFFEGYYNSGFYNVLNSKTNINRSLIYNLGKKIQPDSSTEFIKENFNNIIESIIDKKQNKFEEYITLYNLSYDEDNTLNKMNNVFQELLI